MTGKKARQSHVWPKAKDDWYVEGEDCTGALLTVERFTPICYDPAMGGGNIVRALRAAGYRAWGSDLRDRDAGVHFLGRRDFKTCPDPSWLVGRVQGAGSGYSVVCNPPFERSAGTEAFLARCLADPLCLKVALFTEARWLGSEDRARGLWHDCPPNRVWWVAPRPSCPPGEFLLAGGKATGGTPDFIWTVWDRLHPARPGERPTFGWCLRSSP